jgi:hypothetical protein
LIDLVNSRRPISEYEQVVKEWQTAGGNQIP